MGPFGPALALACRIVLAAVLAIAAAGKIADRAVLPTRLQEAGLGARSSRALAVALPVAELVVAVALLAGFHSPVPGAAAVVLLLGFSVFLVRAARRAVPCPCFGAVRTAASTTAASAIVRNGVLVAIAVLATGTAERARPLGTVVDLAVVAVVAGAAIVRVA